MRLVPPTADHRGLRHCPMLSSNQKKEPSSRVEEGVRMAPITIKGALISCLGGNIQKLAKHASFFVTLWYTTPSPFQQSPMGSRHVHGIPFSTALHASALHCPPPRDSDALIAGQYPGLALPSSEVGTSGGGAVTSCSRQMPDIDVGERALCGRKVGARVCPAGSRP